MRPEAPAIKHHFRRRRHANAFLPQRFNSRDNFNPIADAGDAHLFERLLVEVEDNVAFDIVGLEFRSVRFAFTCREPFLDMIVCPR